MKSLLWNMFRYDYYHSVDKLILVSVSNLPPLFNEINSVGQLSLSIFPMQMYGELATWLNILSRLKPVVTEFKLNPTDFLVFSVFLVWVGKKSVLLATIVSRLWVLKLILDFFCLFFKIEKSGATLFPRA